ncbi:hypothetical protein Pmani_028326 [Petrolisthes manimaculis]|uniref:Uncharacterized protein n=1 Tax=Petrolisthes manimaculis TaxID=1843537 RepID=A0AAE1NZP3_9EUCA|nr:hypothetical protein Pmani_028326 [Petrolisthes manimaculis]
MMAMLQLTASTLVTDECLVYRKVTFETYATSIPIHLAHSTRGTNPILEVKYRGGDTQKITVDQLEYGKWTKGTLNLAQNSVFIPAEGDAKLQDNNNNDNNDGDAMVRSEITLDKGLFYTHCAKETPNLVTDFNFHFQLPRTGQREEQLVLYPSEDGNHNITLEIGDEEWVVCKVNDESVMRKRSEGACKPLDNKPLTLTLTFMDDNKMEMALNEETAVSVTLTKPYENVKFKQLEQDISATLVYVQCVGTCPSSPGGDTDCDSSNGALIAFIILFIIFLIITILLGTYILVSMYKD